MDTKAHDRPLMTVRQVADELAISQKTVRRLVKSWAAHCNPARLRAEAADPHHSRSCRRSPEQPTDYTAAYRNYDPDQARRERAIEMDQRRVREEPLWF